MNKLLIGVLFLSLTACGGGYDDIDAMRDANAGYGSTVTKPSNPNPDVKSLWEYSQTGSSKFAKSRSLNTIPTGNMYNEAMMLVTIQKTRLSDKVVETLNITVMFSGTACDTPCSLRYKKNGSLSDVYKVIEVVDGRIVEDSFMPKEDMQKLLRAIKMSQKASITLPLNGVPDAEFFFDFTYYDERAMDL